jgi:hypothetical protein
MGREKGGDTLETRGESVSEVPPARTTTWKSISAGNDGGGGRRRRGFRGSSDYGSQAAGRGPWSLKNRVLRQLQPGSCI